MRGSFEYEWWNVEVKEPTGCYTLECKARDKEHAIRQFKRWYKNNPYGIVGEILWGSLRLDRKEHQR